MKTVKNLLAAFITVLSLSHPVKAALRVSTVEMPWGYDVIIENDTAFEGFQAIEINGRRDLFYVVSGTETPFRCVILSNIKKRPTVRILTTKETNGGTKK